MSRPVRLHTCPSCGAKVWRGLDADRAAIDVTLDHQPVDNFGEAVALVTGRRTYDLIPCRGSRGGVIGSEMYERTAQRISTPPPVKRPVHAEHRCHQPLPTAPAEPRSAGAWPEEAAF